MQGGQCFRFCYQGNRESVLERVMEFRTMAFFFIAFYFLMVDIDDDFMQEENLVTEEMKSL